MYAPRNHLCLISNTHTHTHTLIKLRPATFRYPLWSLLADFKMWWNIATGREPLDLEQSLAAKKVLI